LGDDDVCVVPVGRADDDVGLLDARFDQRIDLQRSADGEPPAQVLPGLLETVVEYRVRLRALVEDADLVALFHHPLGNRRADAAAADDQDEHGYTCGTGNSIGWSRINLESFIFGR